MFFWVKFLPNCLFFSRIFNLRNIDTILFCKSFKAFILKNKTEANNIQASAWGRASIYLIASIMWVHTWQIWTTNRFRRRPTKNRRLRAVVEQGAPWPWGWRRKRKSKTACLKPTRSSIARKRRKFGITAACSQTRTIILIMMSLTVILMQMKKHVINSSILSTLILSSKNT